MSLKSANQTDKKGNRINIWIAAALLLAYELFLLGFVLAHGLCCGDDADLALKARELLAGDFSRLYTGFDPHAGVILPIALLVRLVGNTYWAPGLAILLLDLLLLLLIGFYLSRYQQGPGYAIAAGSFLILNFLFMSRHFEQWFAALGEVPAGLAIIAAALAYFHQGRLIDKALAGALLIFAILTKLTTVIALLSFILVFMVMAIHSLLSKDFQRALAHIRQAALLISGLVIPAACFGLILVKKVGLQQTINKLVNSIGYSLQYLESHSFLKVVPETIAKNEIFQESFGVPFLLFLGLVFLAGYLIRNNPTLFKVYYFILSILVFYSVWWFYFSIGWGRHYIIPLLLGIFTMVLPLLVLPSASKRYLYIGILLLGTSFTWKNATYPIISLQGYYFRPTPSTQTLLEMPSVFSEVDEKDLVITKRHGTYEAIQYITDKDLNIHYFDGTLQYYPPLWVAIRTNWVAVNEGFLQYSDPDTFKRFLSHCRGLESNNGYIYGSCE